MRRTAAQIWRWRRSAFTRYGGAASRNIHTLPRSLVPDSCSDALVLFAHAQGKLRLKPGEVGVLSSVFGSRLVCRVEIENLMGGNTSLHNPLAVIVDTGESGDVDLNHQ